MCVWSSLLLSFSKVFSSFWWQTSRFFLLIRSKTGESLAFDWRQQWFKFCHFDRMKVYESLGRWFHFPLRMTTCGLLARSEVKVDWFRLQSRLLSSYDFIELPFLLPLRQVRIRLPSIYFRSNTLCGTHTRAKMLRDHRTRLFDLGLTLKSLLRSNALTLCVFCCCSAEINLPYHHPTRVFYFKVLDLHHFRSIKPEHVSGRW